MLTRAAPNHKDSYEFPFTLVEFWENVSGNGGEQRLFQGDLSKGIRLDEMTIVNWVRKKNESRKTWKNYKQH